jgi:PAS domain S-box-containing protein
MKDKDKTQEQLIKELARLRQRIAELEESEREHKQVEETLKKSEHERAAVFDSISEHVVYQDTRMVALWANRAAGESVGADPQQLVGHHCYEIWQQRRKPCIGCPVLKARKSGHPEEAEMTTPDGRVWYIRGYPVRNTKGNIIGAVEVTLEITESKQAEEALRESEEKYRNLAERANDGICIEQDGVIRYANARLAQMGGYTVEELIGAPVFDFFMPDELPEVRDRYQRRMAGEDIPTIYETALKHKDGHWFAVEINAGIVNYQGKPCDLVIIRDITERKQAEETLRESEERFRRVVETMEVGLGAIDENGVLTYVNEYLARMLGYSIDEMIGRSTLDFYYDEQSRKEQEKIFKKRKTGMRDPASYEVTWRRKDGQKVYSILSPTPMFDADGHYTGSFAIHTDITERKRMEEALRESEEKFRTFMETASDLMHISDKDLNFTYVNQAMARSLGYSKEEMIGMNISQIIKKEVAQNDLKRNIEELAKKGELSFESVRVAKDGTEIHGELKTVAIFDNDGMFSGTRGVFRDITERKQAEERLQESESRYRTLFESAGDAIFILDPATGRFIDVNHVACERLGYKREELLQLTPADIDSPEYATLVRKRIETLRQRGHLFFETVHVRQDGTSVPTELNSRIITYTGKPVVLSIARDITKRKHAEQELHNSYQQMQEMLVTTVNALASTVEMKDQYTAGHQPRVTQLACAIAAEMGLPEEQIEGIRMAGLIHDIGKIMVPAEILNKPGPLAEIQYEMVKMHPRAAFDILKGIKFQWPVAEIVLQHHERMDGSGYPQGLSGEKILLEARILTVANVVEAMVSHRPYRAAYDIKEALAEISKNKGILYDPVVVDACLKLFAEKRFTFNEVR